MIKPDQVRYWTRSMAMRDADAVVDVAAVVQVVVVGVTVEARAAGALVQFSTGLGKLL